MWKEPIVEPGPELRKVLEAAVNVVDEAKVWKRVLSDVDERLSDSIIQLELQLVKYGCCR